MSLIILPSEADQKKTYYALNVQAFLKYGGAVRGHIDADRIACMCLRAAKLRGCEDIVVAPKGIMPQRFTVKQVEEAIRKNPERYRGWYQPPPQSDVERHRERIYNRYFMPNRM